VVEGDIFKLCPQKLLNARRRRRRGFDFIISNPPYIAERDRESLPPEVRNENPTALYGGEDGTLFHRFFAERCGEVLNKGGFMVLEFEPFQKGVLEKVFKQKGWKVEFVEDFAGYPRVLIARKGG
jgi:release factor glutamine methyltransferase